MTRAMTDCHESWLLTLDHDQAISDATRKSTPTYRSFMLSEDDPKVVDAFPKLEGRALSEPEIKKSLTEGCSWPRCHCKHQTARQQMARRVGVEAIASWFVTNKLVFQVVSSDNIQISWNCMI